MVIMGKKYIRNFKTVLNKNRGLKVLKQISKILGGVSVNMDGLLEDFTII